MHYYDIDGYETITDVDDVSLVDMVRRQPVVGLLPLTSELDDYGTNPNVVSASILIYSYSNIYMHL